MRHFWNWDKNDDETRTLYLEGVIAEQSWFDDDVTPAMFKEELFSGSGPITLHVNSPGGDCIAASQIYTMLMEYPHDVTVQIDGMAASAASVIAMAGTKVTMSPTSMMMIHNPFTAAMGDSEEMRKAIQLLDEVKESIINAYQIKTGLSRAKLSHLMDSETWMNAKKAKELGFCDEILFTGENELPDDVSGFSFGRRTAAACLMNRVIAKLPRQEAQSMPDIEPISEQKPESEPRPETDLQSEPDPHTEPDFRPEPDHQNESDPQPESEFKTDTEPQPMPDNRIKAADLEKRLQLLKIQGDNRYE